MVDLISEDPSQAFDDLNNRLEEDVFVFPASFGQQRLWFLDQFEPGSPFYNIPMAVRLSGPLDVEALGWSLNEIVRRHEALRTTFATLQGEPVQVISPRLTLALPVTDLGGLPRAGREACAITLAQEEARRPFNLAKGPLLRARLLRLDERDHIVLVTMHHIVSDGWSMGVFIQELVCLYEYYVSGSLKAGRPSPLPELTIQYADFADWQRGWLKGEILEEQLSYWRERLGDIPPELELPTDRPRPAVQTNRGANYAHTLPKDLLDALKTLSQREGCTLFMTLLAAFQTLLFRYSGQTDVSVGSPIANRNRGEIENLIGLFINTLVLRTDLSGGPTFRELLHRVREVTLGAYAHQDMPFETLVEALQPDRDMSHSPLFQVMFILQNANTPAKGQPASNLVLSQIDVDSGTATFDLTLSISEIPDGMDASVEYNTDLFDRSTISRMLQHFETLLQSLVANPDLRIDLLPLLTGPERQQLLVEWNNIRIEYPEDLCIHQLFEAQAARTPDAIAVVVPASAGRPRQTLTYAELNRRANHLAAYLRGLGIGPEKVVAVCVERSLEMIIGVMGVMKAGGAYLPLDPLYPQERLAFMLADSQASILLTQEALAPGLPSSTARMVRLDADWEEIAREDPAVALGGENLPLKTRPENLVYMIYTSGTTGQSKGVMLQHSCLVNAYLAWESAYRLRCPDVTGTPVASTRPPVASIGPSIHLQMANFSFDVFSGDLVRALCSGGRLVLCPRELLLAPKQLYELMRQEGVDAAEFVPAVLRQLIQYLEESGQSLDFMRLLVCGSDSWYVEEYKRFMRFCGPETRLINSFGLTEATIDSSYFESASLDLAADQVVPIGRPFANTRLYILDSYLQPVPVGIAGELFVGGSGVARGYYQRPDLTAERFIPDPFNEFGDSNSESQFLVPGSQRLYKTGDLARFLPDGNIEFLGRLDHQIKIRGFRIETGEIESVLRQHPSVMDAVVLAVSMPRPASDGPGGMKRLVAYLVPQPGIDGAGPFSHTQLRLFLKAKLPDYMVPSAFVVLDALPLTPNGKIDRQALPEPDWSRRELGEEFVAPRTPVEELLARIWSDVLGIGQVGAFDNFFELGGHSLLATQVISRIRDSLAVDLPLRNIFESPTVASLAEHVEVAQRAATGTPASPIAPVSREGLLPLSFAQQRLWFLDQLEPDSPFYNLPEAVRLVGRLDIEVLEQCLNEVVRRHEVLRTTFTAMDGTPVQVIVPELKLAMPVVDLRRLPPDQREEEAMRIAHGEAQEPFNLAKGPLLRARLLCLAEEEHIILLTMHHICGDDWSTGILIGEVAELYAAISQRSPSPLPPLPVQYADFASWQRNWLQGEVLQKYLDYWKGKLAGLPPLLELPTDRPRPAVQTFRGDYEVFSLSPGLSLKIKELCRREGVTLFMLLLGAFQTLMYRYSGQDDVSVGTPIANRNRADIEGLVGFFVNTLVLRTDLSGEPSFRELLKRVRETALGAYAHQDLPFEMIVDALQPERNLSHSPLFQVMLVIQNTPRRARDLPGLAIRPVEAHSGTAKFDLTLFMIEEGDHLSGAWEFNTDLFDRETVQRMVEHFRVLLDGIVADPDQPVSRLPLLTEAEKQKLLVEWNATAAPFPEDLCVHQLFEAQVEQTPAAIALAYQDEQMTYAELNRRANQLAHFLQQAGVGPEVLVGICVERSPEMLVGLLGILKAGGAYVPLDPTYPPERLAFMIQDARMPVLLTQERLQAILPDVRGDPSSPCQVICLDQDWPLIAQESPENPVSEVKPDNLAYVIYTSGSTGKPKGAMILHRGVTNYLTWCKRAYPLGSGQGAPVHSSISFDLTVTAVFAPLVSGRRVLLLPEGLAVETLGQALREESDFSLIKITPAHLQVLGQQLTPQEAAGKTRSFIIGGENLTVDHIAFWQKYAPETALVNEYGPTETVVGCCVYWTPLGAHSSGVIPIGRPIINTRLYILDLHQQPVPIGVRGELYIGGVGVARGYLNRPDLTEQKFIPDPFSQAPGARMYRTGDLVRYLPDGNIECLGRMDFQVKIRGFRVELGEIESVLGQHTAVKEVVVWVREEGGSNRLVAYLVPELPEEAPTAGELREFLRAKLPDYMLPAAFVFLEALPLTSNGKVDRRALPAPDFSQADLEGSYTAPRSPEEEIVSGIWAQVLGLSRVSIHDNFFELGGHSLLATQVISRVRDAFAVELPLRTLFETPTIAGLAGQCAVARREAQGLAAPPVEAVPRSGDLPLSFAQQRLWFLDQLDPDSPLYNILSAVRLTGPLDIAALEQALNEIVRRHEALRTTFKLVDGRGVQVIAAELFIPLEVIDLGCHPQADRAAEAFRLAGLEAQRPFNLARGPLIRTLLLRLSETEHIAILNTHHIVSDDWSLGVFTQELAVLYEYITAQDGRPYPLPDLPFQYADFAAWQRNWLQGEILESQLSYWKEQLALLPPVLDLPADCPRPAVQTYRGGRRSFQLPVGLSDALKTLSRNEGATLFMTLLAAFQVLLYRYSGQTDIPVGTPIANRNRSEIERLIGFFVNTLVMRTDLSGGPSFRQLVQRVREVSLGAYAHQDVPFEMLVDRLQPERDLSRSPLFQVMFVLQNAPRGRQAISSDLVVSPFEADDGIARFDLTLIMVEDADGLSGSFEYNLELYNAETLDQMVCHFTTLLESVVSDPDRSINRLQLLAETELRQMLVDWNDTGIDFPQDRCIHELFEAQVAQRPQATAVIFEDQTLTYAELDRRANQLAHYLRRLGVGPEGLVAISTTRSLEMITGILGILKAGGAYLPLDPTYPTDRLAFMLADSQAPVLLTQAGLLPRLPAYGGQVVRLDADWERIARESEAPPASGVRPDHLAYVIYTSGSTGRPKGALLQHRGLCNLARVQRQAFGVGAGSRVLQFSAFSFDASVWETFMALANGGTLVLARGEVLAGGAELVRLLEEGGVSQVTLPPSVLRVLPGAALPGLKTVISAGEACTAELVGKWGGGREFYNAYGPTETTVCATLYRWEGSGRGAPPIGRPVGNTQVYILDRELQPVPRGVPGELHVGGVSLARGYLNRPELTAERFIANPFSGEPGQRLYKTGDLARYLPDGNLEFLGRIDQQVKIRGFRIELGEIESVLSQHPEVNATVVLVREDPPGHKRLVAYIIPSALAAEEDESGSSRLKVPELKSYLQEKLPEYMVPGAFVFLDELPLMPNGKVDRRALPAPDQNRIGASSAYVAPRTPEEEILVEICAQVLGLEQNSDRPAVGVQDNFFELGGDSILSIQVISRVNQAGLRLTPRQLFEHPTIEALAAVAEKVRSVRANQGIVEGSVPLAPAQVWFFEQEFTESHHWNRSLLLAVPHALDPVLLENAMQILMDHHDALRLRFILGDTGWVGIEPGSCKEVPFTYVDLAGRTGGTKLPSGTELPGEEWDQVIAEQVESLQASLDLEKGPLVRIACFNLGEEDGGRLFMTAHHLVVDDISWPILLEDFQAAYDHLEQGRDVRLPPKTTSYQDWSKSLVDYLDAGQVTQELDYWLSIPKQEALRLPLDFTGGLNTEANERRVSVSLTGEETGLLFNEVPAAYRTETPEILLTALAQALSFWTGSQVILVDLPGHGRDLVLEGIDVSRTVGCFDFYFPAFFDLRNAKDPASAITGIKEQMRQILPHGMNYGLLRYLAIDSETGKQMRSLPQPEVKFNFPASLDLPLGSESGFEGTLERVRGEHSPDAARSHILEINHSVSTGKLVAEWFFSADQYQPVTIERLALCYIDSLRALIAHCHSPEAGGFTASDFSDFGWGQEDLNDILSAIGGGDEVDPLFHVEDGSERNE